MPDLGPYLAIVATAAVGGVGGYFGNTFRTRSAARTGARLVHAELQQNVASVIYYRQTMRLVAPEVRRAAWDANSEALARLPRTTTFSAISDSYQALEGIGLIAGASMDEDVPDEMRPLLDQAIVRLTKGLKEAGRVAGLSDELLEEEGRLLAQRPSTSTPTSSALDVSMAFLALPAQLQDRAREARVTTSLTVATSADPAADTAQSAARRRAAASTPRRFEPSGGLPRELHRLVLDAQGQQQSFGPVARREGEGPTGDVAVDEAYDGLGISYDFFRTVFGWDFHAHYGTPMRAVVHYGESYNNMFWDGTQFIYGDGDGELFYRFTRSLEVTGHEVALGAVQSRLQLPFRNQPGALLHSLADVFGVLVRQYHLDQSVDQADWLVGDGLFVPRPGVHALRSISQPGTGYQGDQVLGDDPQPDHMSRYVRTEQDQGGVHINSGIPNRAFYLAAVAIGGKAWEGAGAIWWQALADSELNARSGFRAFAGATVRAAGTHVDAVADAWRQVGVRLAGRSAA